MTSYVRGLMVVAALLAGTCALADDGQESQRLLSLLVDKGVITQQDADDLQLDQLDAVQDDFPLARTEDELPSVGYKKGAYIRTQGGDHELHCSHGSRRLISVTGRQSRSFGSDTLSSACSGTFSSRG